jgi:hypothetical protein
MHVRSPTFPIMDRGRTSEYFKIGSGRTSKAGASELKQVTNHEADVVCTGALRIQQSATILKWVKPHVSECGIVLSSRA